jgi:hypothetical protein
VRGLFVNVRKLWSNCEGGGLGGLTTQRLARPRARSCAVAAYDALHGERA